MLENKSEEQYFDLQSGGSRYILTIEILTTSLSLFRLYVAEKSNNMVLIMLASVKSVYCCLSTL